jgi:hypothetical protein
MPDLFANITRAPARIGEGNGLFLHDLAAGVSDAAMASKLKAGEYPDLHMTSVQGWRGLVGRFAAWPAC